jgi:cell division protease FtsH
MVAYLGMSDSLSNLCYYNNQEYGFTKPYSDSTAEKIDAEVSKLIQAQYERAKRLLSENAEKHAQLANLLCDKEVIFTEDVENIFGKRPWKSRADEILEEEQKPEAELPLTDRTEELEAVKQMIEEERKQAAAEEAQSAE